MTIGPLVLHKQKAGFLMIRFKSSVELEMCEIILIESKG